MSNWIKAALDGVGLVREGQHDIEEAMTGSPYDTTKLAHDIVDEIADFLPHDEFEALSAWLTVDIVEQALNEAFSFIKARKPA